MAKKRGGCNGGGGGGSSYDVHISGTTVHVPIDIQNHTSSDSSVRKVESSSGEDNYEVNVSEDTAYGPYKKE